MSKTSGSSACYAVHDAVPLAVSIANAKPSLILHNRSETISNFIRSYGVWQRAMTAFIIGYLKEGDVFVDVGANLGYFSVCAGLCVGSAGQVHAIEPDPDNADLLAKNVDLNNLQNVHVHRTAASDYCGEAMLFQGKSNAGSHSIIKKEGLKDGLSVPVSTLDRLLEHEQKIKLIKIDVQGAEVSVLRGMQELLSTQQTRPGIIMEFSSVELTRLGELDNFFTFVSENGYSLRAFISNERSSTKPPQIRRATLRQIANDLVEANDAAEFDILLLGHR